MLFLFLLINLFLGIFDFVLIILNLLFERALLKWCLFRSESNWDKLLLFNLIKLFLFIYLFQFINFIFQLIIHYLLIIQFVFKKLLIWIWLSILLSYFWTKSYLFETVMIILGYCVLFLFWLNYNFPHIFIIT